MIRLALKFARIDIVTTMAALVLLGSIIGGSITWKSLLAFVAVISYVIHANSINDLADIQIDSINFGRATDRPLLERGLGLDFWVVHFMAGILALLLSFLYGTAAIILTLFFLVLSYIYSLKPIRLTDRTFASPLLLAAFYTYYPLSLGFWSAGGQVVYPWVLSVGIYLAFVARMFLKDFRDVKGDKQFGKKTFLIQYGAKATSLTSATLWILALFVVLYAMRFALDVLFPLVFGLLHILLLLYDLQKVRDRDNQQKIINFIRNAGNFSILIILVSLAFSSWSNMTPTSNNLWVFAFGGVLLTTNLIWHLRWRSANAKRE